MKSLIPITGYTFNAALKTITFIAPYDAIPLANIRLITHLPSNIIIYQFNKNTKGGTKAGAVLTLTFDTTPYNNADELAIDFNWEVIPIPVSFTGGGDATAANQVTEIARLTSLLAQFDVSLSTRATEATLATRASEATVAAILAKIIVSPATEATLSTRASEVTAAAILAKLIVAPSTEAKQDAIITILSTLATDATLVSGVSAILTRLTSIDDGIPAALGQDVMANSMPVVIASDQSPIPISGSVTVTGAGDASAANQTIEIARLTSILAQLDVALSSRAAEVTMAAAVTALNSIDGGIPLALGQGVMATSMKVVIASDQSAVAVTGPLTDTELRASDVPISAAVLPLPTGAATAALQTQPGVDIGDVTVNNAAGAAAVNIQDGGNSITVDGPLTDAQLRATPVPISGSVTVTGAGDATTANQVTEIARLTSILAQLDVALSTRASEATLGSIDFAKNATLLTRLTESDFDTKVGSLTETAPLTDTASSGLNGRLQRIAQRISSFIALLPAALGVGGGLKIDGSGTALPVSGTLSVTGVATEVTLLTKLTESDFDTKIGSLTETAPISDTASSGLNGRLQRIAQRITSLIAVLPASLGQKAKAASLAVTLASDEDLLAYLGIVTETAPASDTASSGLNGRLQRIAQRLTTLLAVFPTTLAVNSGLKDNSTLRVVLATDQPQLTNKLLVTPDANSAVNVAQINGVTPLMGEGVTGTGALRVVPASAFVSTVNSSTAALGAGSSFLGTFEDVSAYTEAVINAHSNVASSAGGLIVIQSSDGVNSDISMGTYTIAAATGRTIAIPIRGRFMRVLYSNSGTIQTTFRLQTMYKRFGAKAIGINPTDSMTNEVDAEQAMALLMHFNGTVWNRATGDVANGLDVDVTRIAAGTNRLGKVQIVDSADVDQTTAKATQASRGLGVQNLTDAGRTAKRYYCVAHAAAATTTEQMLTLTHSSQDAATALATSFTPTTGKTFRITHITVATRGHATATIQTTTFNIRLNTGGAAIATSTPILLAVRSATPATASAWDRVSIPVPEGIEIYGDGTKQWGVSSNSTYTTNAPTLDVTIIGYEY